MLQGGIVGPVWGLRSGGGGGGLAAVESDTTLTGDGTTGDPLAVAKPAADTGAQVNPLNTVRFSAQSGNTVDDIPNSTLGLRDLTGQVQSGSIQQVLYIDVADENATFGQDASDPSTKLDAVNASRFFGDKLANGGTFKLALIKRGTTEVIWVQVDQIAAHVGGWRLSALTWEGDTTLTGNNDLWNVAAGSDAVFVDDIVDLAAKYVSKIDLEGHENDFYGSYTNALLEQTDKRGFLSFFTQATGPPTDANAVAQTDIADRNTDGIIAFGATLRTDKDPNTLVWQATPNVAADYVSGQVYYISVWDRPEARVKVTLTSNGTLVGTGNAAYIYATATWDEVNDIPDVTEVGNYFLISTEEPSDLDIRLSARDILNDPWLDRDKLISPTAPTNVEDGMLWVDTTNKRLKQYIAKPSVDSDRYTDLTDIATSPHGFIAHGDDAWVIDRAANKAFHFLVPDAGPLLRDTSRDFSLDSYNNNPVGACTDGTRIWVGDNGRHKGFAYSITDGTRLSSYDITFDSNNRNATSLGTDGSVVWVGDNSDGKAYAHTIGANMPRNAGKDLTFTGGLSDPHGMGLDGDELYIIDATDDIGYAHTLSNSVATADPTNNFNLVSGAIPVAADFDKGVLWVTDNGSVKHVQAYRVGWHPVAFGLGDAVAKIESILEKKSSVPLPTYGTTFPSNPVKGQRLIVSKDASTTLTAVLDTFDKTGETSSLATFTGDDIAWANLQNYNGVHIGTKTQAQRDLLNSLGNGDSVHFIDNSTDGSVLTLHLTGSASSYTFNGDTVIVFPNTTYSNTISANPFIDERSYEVVPTEEHPTRKDEVWEWTGLYWKQVTTPKVPTLLATIANLGTSYTNLGSPMEDSDIIAVSVKGTIDSNVQRDGDTFVVASISSGGEWIPIKGSPGGARVQIRKQTSGQLQVLRAGTISSVRVDLIKLN